MPLSLIRHTQPMIAAGICYGRTDIDVATDLQADADAIVPALGAVDRIVTSPLSRCQRLANLLGVQLGVAVSLDPRWQEMDFGGWEGQPWSDIPRGAIDAWAADFMAARPHGGESVAMLLARTNAAVAACDGPACVLAVTHAGPIRAALFARSGDAAAWQRQIPFGEPLALDAVPQLGTR